MVDRPATASGGNPGCPSVEEILPRQFGKYTLLRKLATGGMAELFLAILRSVAGFEKLVVIKRILPAMNRDQAFIDMLLHEARIAATLSHPNIVQIFDVGQCEGQFFIAMEHIHGEDLRAIVRAMKRKEVKYFPLEHSLGIMLGICNALAYAHEKRDLNGDLLNIVHRDISPQNIIVTFTGDVKVVDFGIAKSNVLVGEHTQGGQLKGKVPYMSPEQAMGGEIDHRSDIFAAGVILFELTTGKRLFRGPSEFETLKLILERDYPKPSQIVADYPEALERIVMRALSKQRDERYASARQMLRDLEEFIRDERIAVSHASLAQWMEMLFDDALARHTETLSDIKQLADSVAAESAAVIARESSIGVPATHSGTSNTAVPPQERVSKVSRIFATVAAAALFAAVGAYVFRSKVAVTQSMSALAPASAPAMNAEVVQKGSIELKSNPSGCAIWINGDLRSEVTPANIDGLPLDREINIRFTKEGYETYKETMTLSSSALRRTITGELKTISAIVDIKVDPSSANVMVDGKAYDGDRSNIASLSVGAPHQVVLSAPGYASKTITLTLQPGEKKTIDEKLDREANTAADAPTEHVSSGSGKVRVGAKGGYCNVSIQGTAYGATPVEATVNAGFVRVVCKPDSGPSQSQSVRVAAGETTRVSFKLE